MLEILIPTYNRAIYLSRNLQSLESEIMKHGLQDKVKITISDNASQDDTDEIVASFKKRPIRVHYHRNESNIGLERNMVEITKISSGPYLLYLGDDDYLAEGYLSYCLKKIEESPAIALIIPGIGNLTPGGKFTPGRLENFDEVMLPAGYDSALKYSHFGHQLSGLVFKGPGFLDFYLDHAKHRNLYPFVNFVTYQMLNFPSLYVPKFKTAISIENEKDWSYNNIGLIDEVYKAYYPFTSVLEHKKVTDLVIRFIVMHSYRLDFEQNPLKLFGKLIDQAPGLPSLRRKLAFLLLKEYIKNRSIAK